MRYDEQYYIAFEPKGGQIYAKPDSQTGRRRYHFEKVLLGGALFVFENSKKDRDIKRGDSWPVTDVLLVGGNFLIEEKIHSGIKQYAISGMQYYPSIYIDDGGKSYENYWFMTFYQSLDCWCRKNSKKLNWKQCYDSEDASEVEKNPSIVKYSLDENVLDTIQEENRLMFKMGGTSVGYIFCHKKIVDYFTSNAYSGVRFLKVSTFREGDQFD